jgi:predicted RNA-binding protein with PIN domain
VQRADATLYLFDGFNVLHAGGFEDVRELTDALASFVAMKGARGVVVFDGAGADETLGMLEVRWAPHADSLLERLAAEHRETEAVCLVTSDAAVRGTSGAGVAMVSSALFASELEPARRSDDPPRGLAPSLDDETRARLERLRRGESGV